MADERDPARMHRTGPTTEVLTQAVVRHSVARMRLDPPPLDHPRAAEELRAMAGGTITSEGLGGLEALRIFEEVLAPACLSVDHPRFLSFVPAAPTEAAILFDLVVGAASIYAGSWMEGAGAAWAELEALRWLAGLAGFPAEAAGVFVSGGTAANLSALAAARHRWRQRDPAQARTRALVISSTGAHSSIALNCRVLDADLLTVTADERGRLHRAALAEVIDALDDSDRSRVAAIVATAGTTNVGVIDDLAGAASEAARLGCWFHVDAAYGGAALAAPAARPLFAGIERADSFTVDPHKWLFAPFDCAALVYRDPWLARSAFTQHAEYLDVLTDRTEWNSSDFAIHLSRRARGLPFWFSLAAHGTQAYADAVTSSIDLARAAAGVIRASDHLVLELEPELSIVVFTRKGWTEAQYHEWSDRLLRAGTAFVVPTSWNDEPALRCCFVNPRTTLDDVRAIVDSLR